MPRHRLGVVLLVAQPLATEIDGIRRAIGDADLHRIPPHITLVPPVNVHDRDLLGGLDLLRRAAAETQPFSVAIGPATTFHPVTPTVYLDVRGDLDSLHALRSRVFRPPFERRVEHEFVPHLTIDADHAPERIGATTAALHAFDVEVTFDRVHILRESDDRVWRPFADAPFAAPATVGRGGLPLDITVSTRPDPEAAALLAVDGDGAGRPFAVTARRDGRVVGAAWGWTGGAVLEIADLAVAVAARNQGIGRHLLAAVEAVARDRACASMVTVAPGSGAAAALLNGAGWRTAGDQVAPDRRQWVRQLAGGGAT